LVMDSILTISFAKLQTCRVVFAGSTPALQAAEIIRHFESEKHEQRHRVCQGRS
jgi:hypothetical protein